MSRQAIQLEFVPLTTEPLKIPTTEPLKIPPIQVPAFGNGSFATLSSNLWDSLPRAFREIEFFETDLSESWHPPVINKHIKAIINNFCIVIQFPYILYLAWPWKHHKISHCFHFIFLFVGFFSRQERAAACGQKQRAEQQ